MTVPAEWEPFRVELREATLRNLRWPTFNVAQICHDTPHEAARRAASWLHAATRYRFAPALSVCAAEECVRRGFSACADAAAIAGAAALICRAGQVDAVLRTSSQQPGYAHVVLVVDGKEVDPYAFRALPESVSSQTARWSLKDDIVGLIGSPDLLRHRD